MLNKQNVFLITAIGSFSAKTVIDSIRAHDPNSKIIGTDVHKPEWHYLNNLLDFLYKVPKANNGKYVATVIELIKKHKVDFIMPLTDPEVDVLSAHRNKLPSFSTLTLSDPETIEIFRDKKKLAAYFNNETHFKTIPTINAKDYGSTNMKLPLIAKIINGRSSEGFRKIKNADEIKLLAKQYILQPIIDGDIITIDIVVDCDGNFIQLPRKELIRTKNGAGLTVEIFTNNLIYEIVKVISSKIKILGAINIEFIEAENSLYLMDVNPRFSAGIAFSKLAGFDVVKHHVKVFENKKISSPSNINKGIYFSELKRTKQCYLN